MLEHAKNAECSSLARTMPLSKVTGQPSSGMQPRNELSRPAARQAAQPARGKRPGAGASQAVFLFFILYSCLLQKYIFVFEIYMNIPRPPCCRAAGTWPPGSRAVGVYLQKKVDKKLRRGPWRTGRPAAGRPTLQAARQRSGGPWPPACGATGPPTLYKVLVAPHPLICLTKNPEKKKREGGRERRGEGEAKRRSPAGFSSRRL